MSADRAASRETGHRSIWTAVAGLLVLYALTAPRVHSTDAYYYFADLEHGDLQELLHPHHLLYELLGKAWFELWRALGYAGRSALALQSLSLLAAGVALLVFGRLARRTCGPGVWPWLLLGALGVSYLPWHFAGEGEPVAFFLLFACAGLSLLDWLATRPTLATRQAVALGLGCGLGVLFHQALAFALPLLAWAVWRAAPSERRISRPAVFLASAVLLAGASYVVAGRVATGSWRPEALHAWATGYLEEFGGRFGRASNFHPFTVARGAGAAFVGGSALKTYLSGYARHDAGYWLALAPFAAVAAGLGAGLVALVAGWRRLPERPRRAIPGVVAFGLIFVAAAIFWEPDNRKFWAPVLPCALLLAGWGGRAWSDRRPGRVLAVGAAALVCLLLLAGNLTGGILEKHAQRDARQTLSVRLEELWRPGDLVVLEGDRVWQSLHYYHPRLRSTPVHRYASVAFASADTTLPHAVRAAAATLREGRRVFVSSDVLDELLRALGTTDPEAAAGLTPRPLFAFGDLEIPGKQAQLFALER